MSLELWLSNLLAYCFQVAVLAGMGAVLPFLLKLRHPRLLLAYWRIVLVICLLLPAIQPWRPLRTTPLTLKAMGTVRVETKVTTPADAVAGFPFKKMTAFALVLGVGVRLVWLGLGLYRLSHYRRRSQPLDPLPEGVMEMSQRLKVNPGVYVSPGIESPATFGIWRPVLLLPTSFLEMAPSCQKAIICHELWHVRRRDWLATLCEELFSALLWFHPAIWWLISQLQLCREQVIDRLVLETTEERKPYLEALLEIARARGRPEVSLAPLFLTRNHLTRRVALILTEVTMSPTRIIFSLVLVLGILSVTGTVAVKAFPLESPQGLTAPGNGIEQTSETVASSTQPVALSPEELSQRLLHQVSPSYPPQAKDLRIQGEVFLEVTVNANGDVDNIRVVNGHALLVLSALDAVKQWKYSPYLKDGVAVPVISAVSVNFTLAGASRPAEQTQGASTVRLGGKVMAANLIYRVEPVYPVEALQKGVEGEVVFEVTVDEQGEVSDVQVLSGNAMLVGAAYEAVRLWRYRPALLNGNPIRAKATVSITFELNSRAPKAQAGSSPNPGTIPTEEEVQRRIAYADARFSSDLPDRAGSKTDRGRVYVTLGPPDQIESHPNGSQGQAYPFEVWRYRPSDQESSEKETLLEFVGKEYRLVSPAPDRR
jgi:TonB family protein